TQIAAATITANEIDSGTITAVEIAAGTITATEIAAGTITGNEITGTTLSGIFADLGSITAGNIVLTDASGAQVKVFSTANKGLEILDDASDTVFEAITGGANVGDITIGNYASGAGLFWDKSAGAFYVRGSMYASDLTAGYISADVIDAGTIITSHVAVDNVTKIWTDSYTTDVAAQSGSQARAENPVLESGILAGSNYERTVHATIQLEPTGFASGEYIYFYAYIVPHLVFVHSGTWEWHASGSGTNEYYLTGLSEVDPGVTEELDYYTLNAGYETGSGVLGSLNADEIGWGDNDALGFNTIYARLTDGTSPQTKSDGYIAAIYVGSSTGHPETHHSRSHIMWALTDVSSTHFGEVTAMTTFTTSPFPVDFHIDLGYITNGVTNKTSPAGHLMVLERMR
ncbi:MAG: hypothetical protein JRC68_10100, partial [Deltaproteobacteria bacterium]|nr:hypothetical protein [Deltaproteobacteria bacterium]